MGPSGPNKVRSTGRAGLSSNDDGKCRQDYAYQLAAAVRALAPEASDSHLFALEVRFHLQKFAYFWHLSEPLGPSGMIGRAEYPSLQARLRELDRASEDDSKF